MANGRNEWNKLMGCVLAAAIGVMSGFGAAVLAQPVQVARLLPSDQAAGDGFGISVAIDGDTVVVGSYYDDDDGSDSGSAYLFERDAGASPPWGEVAKITAADGPADARFGRRVVIDGDTVAVGAHWIRGLMARPHRADPPGGDECGGLQGSSPLTARLAPRCQALERADFGPSPPCSELLARSCILASAHISTSCASSRLLPLTQVGSVASETTGRRLVAG